jgi:15-cis-phytoene desaturase
MAGKEPRTVAVFGAGITGLTAAHELVERGFRVEVYEAEPAGPFDAGCALGGMARTQWSRAVPPAAGGMQSTASVPAPSNGHVIDQSGWLPGEHGFRFFPSFYRNVFDTMARIPIPEDGPVYRETRHSVLDNVRSTRVQAVNPNNPRRAFVLARRPLTSLRALAEAVTHTIEGTGFTLTDLARLQLKLFTYATSSQARRRDQYETRSWWEFMEAERFSPQFQGYLERTPQALVAMTARECDARTQGTITIRLLLDAVTQGARTDGVLNGPTSLAWFTPWRRYLEHRGVVFQRGTLTGFEVPDPETARPLVEIVDGHGIKRRTSLARDYCVVAVPVEEAQRLVRTNLGLRGGDFDRLLAMRLGEPTQAKPDGALEHLSGIQYYFASDLRSVPGHTVYPDAPWGLSSISQLQFWTRQPGPNDGYGGLLSVDIGDWHTPSTRTGNRPAWECTRDEIAREVWAQIRETLPPDARVQDPILYHLDDNMRFTRIGDGGRLLPACNTSPMLINRVREYRARPGAPGQYDTHCGGIVLAGPYMQTHTRLTTMEAANESARHAVNAILRHADFVGETCQTWDPEDVDLGDLAYLVDVDARLHAEGLPHLLEILGLDRLPPDWREQLAVAGHPPAP